MLIIEHKRMRNSNCSRGSHFLDATQCGVILHGKGHFISEKLDTMGCRELS